MSRPLRLAGRCLRGSFRGRLTPRWQELTHRFPALTDRQVFVRGVGEHMPFRSATFDAVVAFWSLNHVGDPGRVVQEIGRVLRSGGRLLLVLEDMEPRWRDLLVTGLRKLPFDDWLRMVWPKARATLSGSSAASGPGNI